VQGHEQGRDYKFAYPRQPFDVISGRAMKSSALTLTIANNQGTGDIEYRKVYDVHFPPSYLTQGSSLQSATSSGSSLQALINLASLQLNVKSNFIGARARRASALPRRRSSTRRACSSTSRAALLMMKARRA
jgi:hypothetical protein